MHFSSTALAAFAAALALAAASGSASATTRARLSNQPLVHQPVKTSAFTNPIVPDPPIVRPNTASCTVTLISKYPFQNFTPATGAYAPPSACPGPWSKVVLDVETSVSGVQFDRLGALWLGNNEIYRFTTSEPPGPAIHWHVAKDVTEYAPVLSSADNFTYSLGNVVNGTYTGIYLVTAKLTFYETGHGWPAAQTPDAVLPIADAQVSPPWFTLNTPSDQASGAVIVPANSERAELDLYATGHGCEEFWYANESTAFESQLGSTCGGTAFREIDVFIDGRPAGVAFPFAYLYTGAIDPIAWLPLTGYDTLDIPAYRLDVTPFVGLMNDGAPHTIAAQVYNDTGGFWLADADLLVWDDHGSTQTHGRLLSVKSGPNPPEHYVEHLTVQNGGTATYWGMHHLAAKGYVTTSHGRINAEVDERLSSRNHQILTQPTSPNGTEIVKMSETGTTVESLHGGGFDRTTTTTTSYPFMLSLTNSLAIAQSYASAVTVVDHGHTLQTTKNVDITVSAGNGPQSTTEHFVLKDSRGYCYDRSLAASNGKLLSDTYACR